MAMAVALSIIVLLSFYILYKVLFFAKEMYRKTRAVLVIRDNLDYEKRLGLIDDVDEETIFIPCVNEAWKDKPDIFNGRLGEYPQAISTALYSLTLGLNKKSYLPMQKDTMLLAAYKIRSEIENNKTLYHFNNVDIKLIELSQLNISEQYNNRVVGDQNA